MVKNRNRSINRKKQLYRKSRKQLYRKKGGASANAAPPGSGFAGVELDDWKEVPFFSSNYIKLKMPFNIFLKDISGNYYRYGLLEAGSVVKVLSKEKNMIQVITDKKERVYIQDPPADLIIFVMSRNFKTLSKYEYTPIPGKIGNTYRNSPNSPTKEAGAAAASAPLPIAANVDFGPKVQAEELGTVPKFFTAITSDVLFKLNRPQAHHMDCFPGSLFSIGLISEPLFKHLADLHPNGYGFAALEQIGDILSKKEQFETKLEIKFKAIDGQILSPVQLQQKINLINSILTKPSKTDKTFIILIYGVKGAHATLISFNSRTKTMYIIETQDSPLKGVSDANLYFQKINEIFQGIINVDLFEFEISLENYFANISLE